MNINLQIKVDSPELMTAILRLAEALPQLSLGSFSVSKGNDKMELITPVPEVQERFSKDTAGRKNFAKDSSTSSSDSSNASSGTSEGNFDIIKALLKRLDNREHMVAVLESYGAKKVSQLEEKDYKSIIKDLEEVLYSDE